MLSTKNKVIILSNKNKIIFKMFNNNYNYMSDQVVFSKTFEDPWETELIIKYTTIKDLEEYKEIAYNIEDIIGNYYLSNVSWTINYAIDHLRLFHYFKELPLKNKIFFFVPRKARNSYYIEIFQDTRFINKLAKNLVTIKFNNNELPRHFDTRQR